MPMRTPSSEAPAYSRLPLRTSGDRPWGARLPHARCDCASLHTACTDRWGGACRLLWGARRLCHLDVPSPGRSPPKRIPQSLARSPAERHAGDGPLAGIWIDRHAAARTRHQHRECWRRRPSLTPSWRTTEWPAHEAQKEWAEQICGHLIGGVGVCVRSHFSHAWPPDLLCSPLADLPALG